jgi:hypothetical protein
MPQQAPATINPAGGKINPAPTAVRTTNVPIRMLAIFDRLVRNTLTLLMLTPVCSHTFYDMGKHS